MEKQVSHIKKILITQNALNSFAGSEIVTLELATFFKQSGLDVTVFTWHYSDPIKTEFKKRKIYVTTDENDKALKKNFDLVWVNHQVLPIEIILNINKKPQPIFIFYHMSYMDNLYLEQPYIHDLERKIGTISLFVSNEALELNLRKYGHIFKKPTVFPNWAPNEFLNSIQTPPHTNKILIVSNHPPAELEKAKQLLAQSNIITECIGQTSTKYNLVTPELLKQYSCIISIGKTVQYCLALNIPIYIYDRFGGCGFLNEKNYEKAKVHNFSGRGFSKKSPEEIAEEITKKINAAQAYQANNLEKFKNEFSLKINMGNLLSSLSEKPKTINLEPSYINYVVAAESLTKETIVLGGELRAKLAEIKSLSTSLDNLTHENDNLKNLISSIENSRIVKLDKKIRKFIPSRPTDPLKKYRKYRKTYLIQKPQKVTNVKILGMVLEKNESLIFDDTLSELEKIVDGFVLLDDNSSDNSIEIAKKHPKCLAIIKNTKTKTGDRSWEESIHRELLLDLAKKYNPDWIVYQDADERMEAPENIRNFMLENTDNPSVSAISFSLFDAYMTEGDSEPYKNGPLLNFRKMFGPERRDIIMAWKNVPSATFLAYAVQREPDKIDLSKVINKFYVQHYGKSLSIKHWEDTCDYYVKHFPQYAEKWQARKGRGVHKDKSDFNRPLITWSEAKRTGGTKIN